MKRLIFPVIVFIIAFFIINHFYSKAYGFESVDKKKSNLVVVSVIDLPTVEITQIYDRSAQVVCYVATGKKTAGRAAYVPSITCIPITELSRDGVKFFRQYK